MLTIAVSGPPASGKTTLALAVGRELGVAVLSRDPLMSVLLAAGRPRRRRLRWPGIGPVGLELQTALLARQVELGLSTVLECVAPVAARDRWRALTAEAGGRFLSVECVCSDADEHRHRFDRRLRAAGGRGPGWSRVEATVIRGYRPDPAPDVVADAVRPLPDLVRDVLSAARDR